VPVRTVSGRVGHRNPSTTNNIYSHWVAETDERAASVVQDRIWTPVAPVTRPRRGSNPPR
jgi:integrase